MTGPAPTAPAAPAAPAPAAPRKGVSLWADAWRRLRKNHMAMAGLVVVILMGLVCTLARFIAPYEATYGFTYVGAQPPGYAHPDALNKSSLRVGHEPEVSTRYAHASTITFLVNEAPAPVEYRVTVRRNKVNGIRAVEGAREVERLDASAPGESLVVVGDDGTEGPPLPGLVVVEKEPLPAALGEGRVLILRHLRPAALVTYEATLGEGEVADPRPEGLSVRKVWRIERLTRGGEELERVELDGRDVVEVKADGKLQVARHLLGTDLSGRDLFSRILYGGQISLLVGLVATLVSLLIGVVYGAVSGYAGGRTDAILMAFVDVLYAIPYMFLVILLLVNFGRDIVMLFVALGAVQWLTMARIVRGQVLSLKQKEFVEAARMSGSGPAGILFGHLIPNTLGVVIVYTTLTVPAVILQESFLAFIGLGVTHGGQNLESWGALVKAGTDALGNEGEKSWLLIWPSLAMAVTLFSLNFLGDGLRDALDPQQRGRT